MTVGMRRFFENLREDVRSSLERGEGGVVACARFSAGVEGLVRDAFVASGAGAKGIAVLAQGGLARRELAPRADVDLLFLVEEPQDSLHAGVENVLYTLWDAGLVLGHAVRTPAEVDAAAREDHHAATALLEARFLAGDEALAEGTRARFARQVLPPIRERLMRDKLEELRERRARFGGSVHLVEPNVKSSPGGLRDLHGALWLGLLRVGLLPTGTASERGGSEGFARLLETGCLYEREATALREANDTLLALRAGLHVISGREEDRLLFQHQEPLAALLGVTPNERETPTEALMRRYFRAAVTVRRTVDDVIERLLPEPPVEPPPSTRARGPAVRDLGQGFFATGRTLFTRDPTLFEREPSRMIDAERVAEKHRLSLSPRTRSQRYQALARFGDELLDDEACGRALLELCRSRSVRARPFTDLLEAGVLRAVMRDIRRLEGRFKQDGYHAYTTDAHICRCVDMALRVVSGAERPPEALAPVIERVVERFSRTHLFVLGALFHDIGKGLEGDHAREGAEIAAREAKRMGLSPEERDVLRFLVEDHLVLSWASQRRDLTDPAVIEELARRVQTPERLDLLAALTWVDIASVAPGMMTDWKGRLLALATERVRGFLLEPESSAAVRGEHEAEVRRRTYDELRGVTDEGTLRRFVEGASVRAIASRLEGELVEDLAAFAAYDPESGEPVVTVSLAEGGHAHTLRVVCRDRRGLLGDMARALSSHGANVLHAHADAREDGIGFDAFRVDDGRGRALDDQALESATLALHEAAKAPPRTTPPPARLPRRTGPRVEPRVQVMKERDTWGATILEVRADDRPGLVADLAHTLSSEGWNIVLAKINTEGTVARDAFYVMRDATGPDGPEALSRLRDALLGCLAGERAR